MFDTTLMKVANTLVGYCRDRQEAKGLDELYAKDAVSVEAADMSGKGAETKGLDGIRGKHDWWFSAHDVNSQKIEGPFFHGADRFGVVFDIDVTEKATKKRNKMRELALYTVKNGKIVREEFYYGV